MSKEGIMAGVIHITDDQDLKTRYQEKNAFKTDIQLGFAKTEKKIQSKYFYDEHGSELFNQITRHPDYYLTQCEIEILNTYKKQISALLGDKPYNVIELGPGEGIKTQILIEQFLRDSLNFTYMPIDISTKYLNTLSKQFNQQLPALKLTPIHSDYFKGLEWLSEHSGRQNLVLFLGSSIGNFDPVLTEEFLHHLWEILHDGDHVLLGFDLRKDINVLMRAYSDQDGITRDFNMNLLQRMNRELHAHFDADKFSHYATYNVYSGAMESYLVSLEQQIVAIDALDRSYSFDAIEPIHVEYSYKYLVSQIEEFARTTGFSIVQHFTDTRNYFIDSLWRVNKQNDET